ncbi:MAG TPA: ElyC/SanA/YdcF family protein [Polyangia bacterium]|jgi:SanA protein|nr:ElyC/SanA/YdcF family protein [Polyangia bacterium]
MRTAVGRKLRRAGWTAAALLLLGFAGVAGANAWVAHSARGRAYGSVDAVPARSVAIVPGARVVDGKPFVHLRGRLETALMLYRGGRVKKILVSGNDTAVAPEATAMSAWLRERGVDPADILVDAGGSRTRETMDRAADVFDIRDAVICTQDVNTSRSVYLAEQAGIDAVAVSVPSTLGQSTRYVQSEALKTTLAFFESLVRD